uniref:Hormone-sensitive lipase n=1 Tax=Panagrellus redivivus TaxID=6233 RepID=A0A7E4VSK6_PANRE
MRDLSAVLTTTWVYERVLSVAIPFLHIAFQMHFFRTIVARFLAVIFGKPHPALLQFHYSPPTTIDNTTCQSVIDGADKTPKPIVCHQKMTSNKSMLGPRLSVQRDAVFSLLKQLATDNKLHFNSANSSSYGTRIAECCSEIEISSDVLQDLVKQMNAVCHKCDYDENTPGNGFRSLICVCDMAALQLISILRFVTDNRTTMMFRISHYCKEIEGFGAVLRFLIMSFQQVVAGLDSFEENSLFPPLDGDYEQYNGFFRGIENLDTSCFYARPLGFQFSQSVMRVFRVIGFVLATYSLSWEKGQGPINSLIHSSKYLISPEQRALRIVKVIRESDIEFCKGFWNLSEIGSMSKWFGPALAISETREVGLLGPLPLLSKVGEVILIPEPSAHTGRRPVPYRILSDVHRQGLSPQNASQKHPLSPYLVIHCHGGGYVATSSQSHETYLRSWAKSLNCPLVSIDYSLAPENPYPRATEEVLYSYAYILNNPDKFGWTGEKIVMTGDSAGGNLIVSVTLNLIQISAARLPDGLVPIYTPFLFQYLPSPSRVLSFMDPLLHMGVVIRCAAAYTGAIVAEEDAETKEATFSGKSFENGHKSLFEYVGDLQRNTNNSFIDVSAGSQSILSLINVSNKWSSQPAGEPQHVGNTTVGESPSPRVSNNFEEPADDIEEDGDNTIQTVQIASDPSNIYLSATNYDRGLIDYLQLHPLTKDSLHVNDDSKPEGSQQVDSAHSDNDACVNGTHAPVKISLTMPNDSDSGCTNGSSDPDDCAFEDAVANHNPCTPAAKSAVVPKQQLSRKKRTLSQTLTDTAALAAGHAYDNITDWFEAPGTPIGFNDKQKLNRAVTLTPQMAAKAQQEEASESQSRFSNLLKLNLPRDPLISPMYASDDLLKQLPPCWFVACHLDPLLDDTIMFARKLRKAAGQVKRVDLLDSVPHGFLNFTLVSPDCREGSKLCVSRIREALGATN